MEEVLCSQSNHGSLNCWIIVIHHDRLDHEWFIEWKRMVKDLENSL